MTNPNEVHMLVNTQGQETGGYVAPTLALETLLAAIDDNTIQSTLTYNELHTVRLLTFSAPGYRLTLSYHSDLPLFLRLAEVYSNLQRRSAKALIHTLCVTAKALEPRSRLIMGSNLTHGQLAELLRQVRIERVKADVAYRRLEP